MEEHQEEESVASANTRTVIAMREADDVDLREMIEEFGTDPDIEFRIYRKSPKMFDGINIEGHCGTHTEMITEEDLKRLYGGGTYQVKIFRPNAKGALQYFKAKSVKIPGNPDMSAYKEKESAPMPAVIDYGPPEDSVLAQQAMATMKELIDKKQDGNGFDPTVIQMIMAPLQAQIAAGQAALSEMQRAAQEKDARIMELIAKKPDNTENQALVHKMFDTEANRSDHLRKVHESEMRTLRENAREDIKRMEDRHRDELRSREDAQRREIENLQRSQDQQLATLKMSYESRLESLKSELTRTERDLTEARAEVAALRVKKDKSIAEQIQEINSIKELMNSVGGGGDEVDKKWYEKVIDAVGENPEMLQQVIGMATRGGGAPVTHQPPQQLPAQHAPAQIAPPQQLQQEQEAVPFEDIPPGTPFRAPDGKIYIKTPDGKAITREEAIKLAKAEEAKQKHKVKKPSALEVNIAVQFIENAFSNGTPPETLASSIRQHVPADIIRYMEEQGVDNFLNEVAKLEPGSPLRNISGRNYMRDVAKFLLEGIPG